MLALLGGCGLLGSSTSGVAVQHVRVVHLHRITHASVIHAVDGRYSPQQVQRALKAAGLGRAQLGFVPGATTITYTRPFTLTVFVVATKNVPRTYAPNFSGPVLHARRGNVVIDFSPAARPLVGFVLTEFR